MYLWRTKANAATYPQLEQFYLRKPSYSRYSSSYRKERWMKKPVKTALLAALLIGPTTAFANIDDLYCDDTARLNTQLANVSGAQRLGQGLRGPDALMEIWITPRNGDWTMVQAYANGTSCIIALGEHWQATPTATTENGGPFENG